MPENSEDEKGQYGYLLLAGYFCKSQRCPESSADESGESIGDNGQAVPESRTK